MSNYHHHDIDSSSLHPSEIIIPEVVVVYGPLFLSLLAGLSTGLGAAVVFCVGGRTTSTTNTSNTTSSSNTSTSSSSPTTRTNSTTKTSKKEEDEDGTTATTINSAVVVLASTKAKKQSSVGLGHGALAFALSLAGSVMITVSIVSILPESFLADTRTTTKARTTTDHRHNNNNNNKMNQNSSNDYISIFSIDFMERICSIIFGCGIYWLLSKCALPEPTDTILELHHPLQSNHHHESHYSYENNNDVILVLVSTNNSTTRRSYNHIEQPLLGGGVLSENEEDGVVRSSMRTTVPPTPITTITTHRKRPNTMLLNPTSDHSYYCATNVQQQAPIPVKPTINNQQNPVVPWNLFHCIPRTRGAHGSGYYYWCGYNPCCSWLSNSGSDLMTEEARRNWRLTLLLFISLAIHNFPEGLAVAATTIHSQQLGITTTIAIALHNIPEGIAIAIPCLAARPNAPCLAFGLALLSGLAEPLGAIVALWVLRPSISQQHQEQQQQQEGNPSMIMTAPVWTMKNVLAFVAGIMITVAIMELFPEAIRHSKENPKPALMGTISGILVMIVSEKMMGE